MLLVIATLLAPLEHGRTTTVSAAGRRSGLRDKPPHLRDEESQPPTTTTTILATTVSGIGATLNSFGLLGYFASGLRPAPLGSTVLLFVPVDPIQSTVWVLVGLALSSLAMRRSRSRR